MDTMMRKVFLYRPFDVTPQDLRCGYGHQLATAIFDCIKGETASFAEQLNTGPFPSGGYGPVRTLSESGRLKDPAVFKAVCTYYALTRGIAPASELIRHKRQVRRVRST